MIQTTETVYEVTVRFDRSKDGTATPSSFVKLYSKTFTSNESYDDCWQKIESYKKQFLNEGVVATIVIKTAEREYRLEP